MDQAAATYLRPTTMGAGASVVGGKLRRLIVYTLFDHTHGGTMFVEGNMTTDDEETLLIDQGRMEEASNAAEADYSNDGNDMDWQPSPTESD